MKKVKILRPIYGQSVGKIIPLKDEQADYAVKIKAASYVVDKKKSK
jgi:hypothetical protein